MLAPKRHIKEIEECTPEEFSEFLDIYKRMEKGEGEYNQMIRNLGNTQSIPGHFHLHLITFLDSI
jgi:diadenosine tetraphosphate (Ap4A) HIT family hydrolase